MKRVASLCYGVIFKKAFCDPEIFTGFVQDILGITLEIDKVETEKEFDHPVGRVEPRFDLFAEDHKNRVIVDIQHVRYPDHYDRFLHYHCAAVLEQVPSSYDYRPKLRVFTIVVLTSGDKSKKDILIADFDPKDLEGVPSRLFEHKLVYLCPKYVTEKTPEPYREWLRAINDTLDEQVEEADYSNALIQKIFDHIEEDGISPKEMARMKDEYSEEELRLEEYEKGVRKGLQTGLVEGRLEMARRMLDRGSDLSFIQEVTGLTEEQIRA